MGLSLEEKRVRFAPSPTGYLHIGGARTAIFNWLYARHHQGKFLLRIEDTDVSRSSDLMVNAIFEGLQWLGLTWDEEPIFQSGRVDYYREVCELLLASERAYYCYCSPERLAGLKSSYGYDRHCRNLTDEEKQKLTASQLPKVLRFRVQSGKTCFEDAVHGSLTFDNDEIDDFVIMRSDGMPTYHLAVVADDRAMNITTIIRGDDHLSNTPKQVMLYQSLGWKPPEFIHVPLILGSDKKRLSKRHGATSIGEYRDAGYMPETIVNFLALLGWSPGDNREIMNLNELIEAFSVNGISAKSAVFDEKKLQWMNDEYISRMSDDRLSEKVIPVLLASGLVDSEHIDRVYITKVIKLLKLKIKFTSDFAVYGHYFFRDPETFDEEARKKYWSTDQLQPRLTALASKLADLTSFDANAIEKALRDLAEKWQLKAGELIHPVRLALTGYSVSPGIFELMEVLGRDVVLRRIEKALQLLKN